MVAESDFEFAARRIGDGVVLVSGEVDLLTAPLLEKELRDAAAQTAGDLVVDLSEVSFMDSAGMNVLVRLYTVLDREHRALVLRNTTGSVRRVLELGGASVFADLR
jgi:anti-sigma B factor antagonist